MPILNHPIFRLVRELPGVDAGPLGAGHQAGDRGQPVLGQVRAGAPLPHRQLHDGGVARGRQVQEGGGGGRPELPPAHQGRGRAPRATVLHLGGRRYLRLQVSHQNTVYCCRQRVRQTPFDLHCVDWC